MPEPAVVGLAAVGVAAVVTAAARAMTQRAQKRVEADSASISAITTAHSRNALSSVAAFHVVALAAHHTDRWPSRSHAAALAAWAARSEADAAHAVSARAWGCGRAAALLAPSAAQAMCTSATTAAEDLARGTSLVGSYARFSREHVAELEAHDVLSRLFVPVGATAAAELVTLARRRGSDACDGSEATATPVVWLHDELRLLVDDATEALRGLRVAANSDVGALRIALEVGRDAHARARETVSGTAELYEDRRRLVAAAEAAAARQAVERRCDAEAARATTARRCQAAVDRLERALSALSENAGDGGGATWRNETGGAGLPTPERFSSCRNEEEPITLEPLSRSFFLFRHLIRCHVP